MTGAQAKDDAGWCERRGRQVPSLPASGLWCVCSSSPVMRSVPSSLSQEAPATAPDEPAVLDLWSLPRSLRVKCNRRLPPTAFAARVPAPVRSVVAMADLMMGNKGYRRGRQNLRKALAVKPDSSRPSSVWSRFSEQTSVMTRQLPFRKMCSASARIAIGYILKRKACSLVGKRAEAVKPTAEA